MLLDSIINCTMTKFENVMAFHFDRCCWYNFALLLIALQQKPAANPNGLHAFVLTLVELFQQHGRPLT